MSIITDNTVLVHIYSGLESINKITLSPCEMPSSINLCARIFAVLFISEYVEGSSQNKALEVYNPTSQTVDLNTYVIHRYSNGSPNPEGDGLTLNGSLEPYQTFIVTNGETVDDGFGFIDPALYDLADQVCPPEYPNPLSMNGNDAVTLSKNGVIVDIIGRLGENPGDAWTDDATAGFTDANGNYAYQTTFHHPYIIDRIKI